MFFPGELTLDQPWGRGDYLSQLPDTHQHLHIEPVPIYISTLVHVTHYDNAEAIISNGFNFKAIQKRKHQENVLFDCR